MDFKRILALILISLSFSASKAGAEFIAPDEDILSGTIYLLSLTQNNNNDQSINTSIETLQQAQLSKKTTPNETTNNLNQIFRIGVRDQDINNWCTTDNKLFSENKKFPEYWPLDILKDLKEGDVFYIKIYGKVIKLTARQKITGSLFKFEQAITFLKSKLKLLKPEQGTQTLEKYLKKPDSNQKQAKSTNKYKTYFKNTLYYAVGLCAVFGIIYYAIIPELQRTYEDFCGIFKAS